MRRTQGQINPNYVEWARAAASSPAPHHDVRQQPTAMIFHVKGKYFNSAIQEHLVVLSIGLGIIMAVVSGVALTVLTGVYRHDRTVLPVPGDI